MQNVATLVTNHKLSITNFPCVHLKWSKHFGIMWVFSYGPLKYCGFMSNLLPWWRAMIVLGLILTYKYRNTQHPCFMYGFWCCCCPPSSFFWITAGNIHSTFNWWDIAVVSVKIVMTILFLFILCDAFGFCCPLAYRCKLKPLLAPRDLLCNPWIWVAKGRAEFWHHALSFNLLNGLLNFYTTFTVCSKIRMGVTLIFVHEVPGMTLTH